jgi:hypothetical protein
MCAQLGHCGEVSLKAALDRGSIAGTHLTSRGVQNAREIFGPCLGCLQGKMTAPREPSSTTQPAEHIGERLHMDLLPLEGVSIGSVKGLLISVDEKSGHMGGASITS